MAETVFWPLSQEQDFSEIEDLGKNTANNIIFHYRTSSGKKLQPKNFIYIKKKKKISSATHNLIRVSSKQFQENIPTDSRMKEKQILFHRTKKPAQFINSFFRYSRF